jgi:hypothetical protein
MGAHRAALATALVVLMAAPVARATARDAGPFDGRAP